MKYKTKKIDGHDVIFSSSWINDLESPQHFLWYHQQASIVYDRCTREDNILEIGIGTALLSDLLKRRGWKVSTLDIDDEKSPDYCANALDFDYSTHRFDVVLAFEIFEHIPLTTFENVVRKLASSMIRRVYFSLPWCEYRLAELTLKVPKVRQINCYLSKGMSAISTPAHFWELSKKNKEAEGKTLVALERVMEVFGKANYRLERIKKMKKIEYFEATLS